MWSPVRDLSVNVRLAGVDRPVTSMKTTAVRTHVITAVCVWTWLTGLNASALLSGPERPVSLMLMSVRKALVSMPTPAEI